MDVQDDRVVTRLRELVAAHSTCEQQPVRFNPNAWTRNLPVYGNQIACLGQRATDPMYRVVSRDDLDRLRSGTGSADGRRELFCTSTSSTSGLSPSRFPLRALSG
jgi:hypothetical protein